MNGAVDEVGLEDALLARAQAGDRAAVEALVERHAPTVLRFVRTLCRGARDADDVAQETLLSMVRGLPSVRGDASLSTWLYAVARNACARNRRRRVGEPLALDTLDGPEGESVPELADPGRSPEEAAASAAVDRALTAAIDALEPGAREVLVLRDVEGLSAAEVAKALDLTESAVKSRLHRARLSVREALAPVLGHEELAPGPSCPDVLASFSRHLEGEIAPADCAQLERHLDGCPRCAGACASLRRTLELCRHTETDAPMPDSVRRSVRQAIHAFLLTPG